MVSGVKKEIQRSKRWGQRDIVSSPNLSKPKLHKSSTLNNNFRSDSNIVNNISHLKTVGPTYEPSINDPRIDRFVGIKFLLYHENRFKSKF